MLISGLPTRKWGLAHLVADQRQSSLREDASIVQKHDTIPNLADRILLAPHQSSPDHLFYLFCLTRNPMYGLNISSFFHDALSLRTVLSEHWTKSEIFAVTRIAG